MLKRRPHPRPCLQVTFSEFPVSATQTEATGRLALKMKDQGEEPQVLEDLGRCISKRCLYPRLAYRSSLRLSHADVSIRKPAAKDKGPRKETPSIAGSGRTIAIAVSTSQTYLTTHLVRVVRLSERTEGVTTSRLRRKSQGKERSSIVRLKKTNPIPVSTSWTYPTSHRVRVPSLSERISNKRLEAAQKVGVKSVQAS